MSYDQQLREVSAEKILVACGGHPLVRHLLPHVVTDRPLWRLDDAVGFLTRYWGDGEDIDGYALGSPETAAALATRLQEATGLRVSMPASAIPFLPTEQFARQVPWGFRWTDHTVGSDPDAAHWLTTADHPEINALLDADFADASARPDSPRVRRWAGIRDSDGTLVACAADTTEAPGVGFVASITTRTDLRGRGLGRRLSGWIIDRLVEEEGVAALWHYGDSKAAARVYDILGMKSLPMVNAGPDTTSAVATDRD